MTIPANIPSILLSNDTTFEFSISVDATNGNLRTLAVSAGWNELSAVIATIDSGVVLSGNTAGYSTAALTIDGAWNSGVSLINLGVIVGRGGAGGGGGRAGDTVTSGSNGQTGGTALKVTSAVSINNASGTIAGGGGGGGGGTSGGANGSGGGGGGGGGRSSNTNSSGGAGGVSTKGGTHNGGVGGAGT